MSYYYMENGKPEVKVYTKHGRTKQSQKDECDINKLLSRAARSDTLSHLDKYQSQYGNFADYDFENHITQIAAGQTIFENLPAEVKREFAQSPQSFFEYVTNPKNADKLHERLPQLAERGNQLIQVDKITTRAPEDAPEEKTPAKPEKTPSGDK